MSHLNLIKRWFSEVWHQENYDAVAELLAPDVTYGGSLSSLVLPGVDYVEAVLALKALITDIQVEITHSIEQGDLASVRVAVTARAAHDKRPIFFTGQLTVRIKDGQFVEFLSNFDYFQMFEQLEQFPPDSLAVCLTGERMCWTN